MASILGIQGYNSSAGSNILLAAYENDIINVATGLGYGLGISSSNNGEFCVFLDRVFYQNNSARPITFNGTAWSTEFVGRAPVSKYIRPFKSRVFLGNCGFASPQAPLDNDSNAITYPSRVFYSDLYKGRSLTWGIEWGRNGEVKTAWGPGFLQVSPEFGALVQDFKESNIKIGDNIVITGNPGGDATARARLIDVKIPWIVKSIDNPYQITPTSPMVATLDTLHFWVGGNWFDVSPGDGDVITGFGDTVDALFVFKLMSLWFYTGSQLRKVKNAPGTSSGRSIISRGDYVYYFHGSDPYITGIYRADTGNSTKISRAIDPYILGMTVANYSSVVGWEEGENLRWYLGDITYTNRGLSMTNAVATYNIPTGAWDVSPVADVITAATTWRTGNQRDTYLGTSDNQVLKMSSGNSHNGTPIRMNLETKVYYPSGSETINEFTRLQVIGRQTKGIKVKLRLWNNPRGVGEWRNIGELDYDRSEIVLPQDYNQASGFQLGFFEDGSLENDTYIEKFTMFYNPSRARLL